MRVRKTPAPPTANRQLRLLFDHIKPDGLTPAERDKIVLALAQVLMQAAGLSVEELDDDKR